MSKKIKISLGFDVRFKKKPKTRFRGEKESLEGQNTCCPLEQAARVQNQPNWWKIGWTTIENGSK